MHVTSRLLGWLGLGLLLLGALLVPLPGPGLLVATLGLTVLVAALVLRALLPARR